MKKNRMNKKGKRARETSENDLDKEKSRSGLIRGRSRLTASFGSSSTFSTSSSSSTTTSSGSFDDGNFDLRRFNGGDRRSWTSSSNGFELSLIERERRAPPVVRRFSSGRANRLVQVVGELLLRIDEIFEAASVRSRFATSRRGSGRSRRIGEDTNLRDSSGTRKIRVDCDDGRSRTFAKRVTGIRHSGCG